MNTVELAKKAIVPLLCGVACCTCGCGRPFARRPVGKAPAVTTPADQTTQPIPAGTGEAEDLTSLLLERPAVPVTPPASRQPVQPKRELPADGTMVVDRRCRFAYHNQTAWYKVTFLPDPTRPAELPRWVLPCRMLEKMAELSAAEESKVFRISGETTVYHDRCFILPTKVTVEGSSEPIEGPGRTRATMGSAESKPAKRTEPAAQSQPSSEDIMKQLMQDRPGKPVSLRAKPPAGSIKPVASVAPAAGTTSPPVGESIVADRLAYLLPDKDRGWWLLCFEADNTLSEPPLRLLPCRLLEKAEDILARAGGLTVRFRVSGQTTLYKGRRHMLLRKLLREREMGQL